MSSRLGKHGRPNWSLLGKHCHSAALTTETCQPFPPTPPALSLCRPQYQWRPCSPYWSLPWFVWALIVAFLALTALAYARKQIHNYRVSLFMRLVDPLSLLCATTLVLPQTSRKEAGAYFCCLLPSCTPQHDPAARCPFMWPAGEPVVPGRRHLRPVLPHLLHDLLPSGLHHRELWLSWVQAHLQHGPTTECVCIDRWRACFATSVLMRFPRPPPSPHPTPAGRHSGGLLSPTWWLSCS